MLYRGNKWLLTKISECYGYTYNEKKVVDGKIEEYFFDIILIDPKQIAYICENQQKKKESNMECCVICLKSGCSIDIYADYRELMDEFENI